ncbi:MAG: TonB-dependent receptor [Rudaea sp.]|uniref:TonB-dependent receptor n=1 Tax=unclassified Rudaea TaxID=2627037 RepID=UPI0010F91696|nr:MULTISPECIES: TonB-dependent receptor [unclassified Rudaea]MBN8887916.1 TonB-dependent receptor [Rudaea sp.]
MCQYRILTLSSVLALSCFLGAAGHAAETAAAPADPNPAAADAQAAPSDAPAITTADAKKTQSMEAVVVTGRAGVDARTKEQTSYSITTISEERLRLQAPTSVTESLKSVPGFWVEATGGEASGNVRARGIPVDGFGSINLLEDGLPIQHDPSLGYLNGDQAFRLDETIDGIEVVRGGPSSLFYSNAPAGAVNYIPRQVGNEASGLFKYTVGDYGLNRGDFWYGTPFGDGWKFSIGGFYRKDDGIRDPGYTADRGGQLRATISKEWDTGKFSFDLKRLVDTVYFDLGIPMRTYPDGKIKAVPGFDGNYGTVAGPETNHITLTGPNGKPYSYTNDTGTQVHRTQATWKFEQEFGDNWKFSDSLRMSDTNTVRNGMFPNQLNSGQGIINTALAAKPSPLSLFPGASGLRLRYVDSPSTYFDLANQNGNGLAIIGGLRSVTSPTDEILNDARVSTKFDFGGQHDFTLGYYLAHVNLKFDRYSSTVLLDVQNNARLLDLVAVDANGNVLGSVTQNGIYQNGYEWANAGGSQTTNAVYFSDEWQVSDRLRIDGGARYERVEFNGSNEVKQKVNYGGGFPNSQVLTGTGQFLRFDRDFNKVGWTLGANYQFDERSGAFARWTKAFRLPNVSSYIDNPFATPIIQTMDLGEIGYKFANRWLELYATGFYTKYNNVGFSTVVFDPNNPNVPGPNQTIYANTKTYGLELEGGIYPVDWFDITFNATIEDPKYKNFLGYNNVNGKPVAFNYSDNQLIRVPKNSIRIVPGLNLLDGKLRLQVSAEYEGARYVDAANTVRLPSYKTYNGSASYQVDDRWTVFGYVDNINNSQGLTEGNPRAGELANNNPLANTFLARPLLGRTYRVSVMYKF